MNGAFNPIIHGERRLKICAVLATVQQAEFSVLREVTASSESVLSKQVKALEEAGYVTTTKGARDGRTRTWATLTPTGRAAYEGHVEALRRIVAEPVPDRHGADE